MPLPFPHDPETQPRCDYFRSVPEVADYQAYVGNGFPASYLFENGYPHAGPTSAPLMDVPEILSPAPTDYSHPLHAPVEVQFPEPALDARMILESNDEIIWWVYTHGDFDSLTVPRPPSTVDEAQFHGALHLNTSIQVFEENPDGGIFPFRAAQSRRFSLIP